MYKKKLIKAFTIAEAMICFILIGVIFTSSLTNIGRKTNYNKLYWQAFNTLFQASKTIYSEGVACSCENNCNVSEKCYMAKCWRNSSHAYCPKQERSALGGTENIDRDFPGFLYANNIDLALAGIGSDEEFCDKLIEKINTYPGSKCKSFISFTDTSQTGQNGKNGGVNFFKAFPSAVMNSSGEYEKTNSDADISPSFIAANGQRFYISIPVTANFVNSEGKFINFIHHSRESYRLVVVDLNGKSLPNSQFQTKSKDPDLVLFAINAIGDVIPIGLPEFSKAYINAVVYYPDKSKSETNTLWNAKKYAWGIDKSDITSGSMIAPYISPISKHEPLSQSSKLYNTAVECMGKVCSNKNAGENDRYADDLFVNLMLQFMFKEEGSTQFYSNFTVNDLISVSTENGCQSVRKEDDAPTCGIDFKND